MFFLKGTQPRGVTLLETLIYVFIFSMLIGGAIATAFWTYESSAGTARIGLIESEADFVLRKLNWATVGTFSIITPSSGANGTTLEVDAADGNAYEFTLNGTTLELNGVPITSNNISVDSFLVTHIAESGITPAAASTTIVINGKTYGPKVKYAR